MPGTSYSGPLPAATPALLGLDARLRQHQASDTPDKLDYRSWARVTRGLEPIRQLAR